MFPEDYSHIGLLETFNPGATKMFCLKVFWCIWTKWIFDCSRRISRLHIPWNIYMYICTHISFFSEVQFRIRLIYFWPHSTQFSYQFQNFILFIMSSVYLQCPKMWTFIWIEEKSEIQLYRDILVYLQNKKQKIRGQLRHTYYLCDPLGQICTLSTAVT